MGATRMRGYLSSTNQVAGPWGLVFVGLLACALLHKSHQELDEVLKKGAAMKDKYEKHSVPRNLFGLWNVSNINHDESLKVSLFGCLLIRRNFLVDFDQTSLDAFFLSFLHSALIYNFCWLLLPPPSLDLGTPWIMLGHHDNPAWWGYKDGPKVENAVRQPKSQQIGHIGLRAGTLSATTVCSLQSVTVTTLTALLKKKTLEQDGTTATTSMADSPDVTEREKWTGLGQATPAIQHFQNVRVPQLTQPLSLPRFSSHWFTGLPGMRLLGM